MGGNDILDGRGGDDFLTGGSGSDVFVYRFLGEGGDTENVSPGGIDTITDFQPGIDRLMLIDSTHQVDEATGIGDITALESLFNNNDYAITALGGDGVIQILLGKTSGPEILHLKVDGGIDNSDGSVYDPSTGQFSDFEAFTSLLGGEEYLLFG